MPGPKSDKIWADAIRKAVHDLSEIDDPEKKGKKLKKLNVLAANLVDKAIGGDVPAMKEVGDRLDGKPAQTIAGDPENPAMVIVATGIVREEDG